MIVVRVELWSAIDGSKRELARMHIANDGKRSAANPRRGDYAGTTFVGRDERALDRGTPSKHGSVTNYPRLDLHIWTLVARMLNNMGYGK